MSDPIGALSYLAVGLEGTAGTPVKAQWEIDFINETIRGRGRPIRSRAINRVRTVKKVVQGAYDISGDVAAEVVPDKWTKLLYSALTSLTTTGTAATGTIVTTGTAVVGTGTAFLTEVAVGDTIVAADGQTRLVTVVTDDTHLTVGVAFSPDVSGVAFTIAPWTHVFKTGATLNPLTIHVLRPQSTNRYFVYPGCEVSRLTFRAQIDAILEATATFAARGKEVVASPGTLTNINESTLALSSEVPFVFHEASVLMTPGPNGGALAANTDTNNWVVNINTGVVTPKGLGAGRSSNRIHPGDSMIDGSFDMVFDDSFLHRRWMGVIDASGADTPGSTGILVGQNVATFALRLKFVQPVGTGIVANSRVLQIDIPKVYLTDSAPEVKAREGVIIQPLTFEAIYSASDSSDIIVTMTSLEPNAQITTVGTNISTYV